MMVVCNFTLFEFRNIMLIKGVLSPTMMLSNTMVNLNLIQQLQSNILFTGSDFINDYCFGELTNFRMFFIIYRSKHRDVYQSNIYFQFKGVVIKQLLKHQFVLRWIVIGNCMRQRFNHSVWKCQVVQCIALGPCVNIKYHNDGFGCSSFQPNESATADDKWFHKLEVTTKRIISISPDMLTIFIPVLQ